MYYFILILLPFISVSTAECNSSTHLDVFTKYSLGQNDEMNKTFDKIQDKVKLLDNVSYTSNGTIKFNIHSIKPNFFFFDAKQKVDIIHNDTIIIHDGRVDVRLPFQFTITRGGIPTNGTGQGFMISDATLYAKKLMIEDEYVVYELSDYNNITFLQNEALLARIDPPNLPKQDIDVITSMFNQLENVTTVKDELKSKINEHFIPYLNETLHEEKRHVTNNFQYAWVDPIKARGNLTIHFETSHMNVDVEPEGLRFQYAAKIKNDQKWECETLPPFLPLSTKVYGSQQLLSMEIYKNTLRYGIEHHFLDTTLNKQHWESRMFQFYAGDLYEVIPKVSQKFLATQEVEGKCIASQQNIAIKKATHESFNVTLNYACDLEISGIKVTKFDVELHAEVEGFARSDHVNFEVVGFQKNVQFFRQGDYQVHNPQLAELMISHSLNRLGEHKVFGSGWPLFSKDYPHFIVEKYYTIVYDSTHVDPDLTPS